MENQVKGPENAASEHEDDDVAKDDSEKVTVTNSEESESKENAEKESEAKEAAVAKKVDDKLKKTVVIGNQVEPSTVTAAKNEVLDGATSQIIPSSDDAIGNPIHDSGNVTFTNPEDDAEEQGAEQKKENPNAESESKENAEKADKSSEKDKKESEAKEAAVAKEVGDKLGGKKVGKRSGTMQNHVKQSKVTAAKKDDSGEVTVTNLVSPPIP